MSCNSTACGSAFLSWARLTAPQTMTRRATSSVFHGLRDRYLNQPETGRRVRTEDEYRSLLERQRGRVERSSLTEVQKASIIEKLNTALTEPMPDQAVVYACFNIAPTLRNRANAQQAFLQGIAARMNVDYGTVEQRFHELDADVPPRTRVSREEASVALAAGMSRDAGTVAAVRRLTAEALDVEAAIAAASPQRITRTPVTDPAEAVTATDAGNITDYGYDPRNGRLEVTIGDEGALYTYRDIPPNIYASFASQPGSVWRNVIRGNPDYQYASAHEATIDGAAPHCRICGQFADTSHGCPPSPELLAQTPQWTTQIQTQYYSDERGTVFPQNIPVVLPPAALIRQGLRSTGSVEIPIQSSVAAYEGDFVTAVNPYGTVTGGLIIYTNLDTRETEMNFSHLACICQPYRNNGTCPHIDIVQQAARDRMEPPTSEELAARERVGRETAIAAAAERVRREYETAVASDWTRDPDAASEAAATWRRDADVLYSENMEAFTADIERALDLAAANNGRPLIPYMTENALDGFAQRGSGQAFGIEIEYTFREGINRAQAHAAIGRELYAAGLASSETQQGYRTSSYRGFRDTHTDASGVSNWSWEADCSVSGELVTPGMYDEPETWTRLQQAVEILTRNGAVSSIHAGAHVHVGTGNWHGQIAPYVELARLVTQHEDALVRLASDTNRGTHRGTDYTGPMDRVPPAGFRSIENVHRWQGGRYSTVNFGNCQGGTTDHPEFRVFDASLDAGTIQAQVKLAVAATAAAERIAAAGGTRRGQEPWGAHARREGYISSQQDESISDADRLAQDSGTVRSLLDTLFRRREDKAQLAAVYAHTRWSSLSSHYDDDDDDYYDDDSPF